jgi:YHS domain-containing protein
MHADGSACRTLRRKLMQLIKKIAVAAGLGLAVFNVATPALAKTDPVSTGIFNRNAVSGYDPVAYFSQGKPVKGSKQFTTQYQGVTWLFSSAANRDQFVKNPAAFAPQYGGYCAWAVSKGYTAPSDPEAWKIVDGKLYLNYDKDVQSKWMTDIPGNIAKADKNWPVVLKK